MAAGPGLSCLISVWAASRCIRTRVIRTRLRPQCSENSPALSNGKTGLSIFVPTFFLSGQRCGFSSPALPRHPCRRLSRARGSRRPPVRSHDLYEILLAGWFARIPRNVPRIRPRSQKRFTRACRKRNGRLHLPVVSDRRPRSQYFRHEKRNASHPPLPSPRQLWFLLRSAHSILCDHNANRSRWGSLSVYPKRSKPRRYLLLHRLRRLPL